jgi:hypothetical protein
MQTALPIHPIRQTPTPSWDARRHMALCAQAPAQPSTQAVCKPHAFVVPGRTRTHAHVGLRCSALLRPAKLQPCHHGLTSTVIEHWQFVSAAQPSCVQQPRSDVMFACCCAPAATNCTAAPVSTEPGNEGFATCSELADGSECTATCATGYTGAGVKATCSNTTWGYTGSCTPNRKCGGPCSSVHACWVQMHTAQHACNSIVRYGMVPYMTIQQSHALPGAHACLRRRTDASTHHKSACMMSLTRAVACLSDHAPVVCLAACENPIVDGAPSTSVGNVSCTPALHNTNCTIDCKPGYSGTVTTTCVLGVFTNVDGTCTGANWFETHLRSCCNRPEQSNTYDGAHPLALALPEARPLLWLCQRRSVLAKPEPELLHMPSAAVGLVEELTFV